MIYRLTLKTNEADWIVEKTRTLLLQSGTSQAKFAEQIGMPIKNFERVLSRRHGLSRPVAFRLFDGLLTLSASGHLTTRQVSALDRMENILRFRRSEKKDKPVVFATALALVDADMISTESLSTAVKLIAAVFARYNVADEWFLDRGRADVARRDVLRRIESSVKKRRGSAKRRNEILQWLKDAMDYPAA